MTKTRHTVWALCQGNPQPLTGGAAALATTRLLGYLLYKVSPLDALSFALAFAVMTVAGLAACLLPALRATRTDPLRALRN